MILIFGIFSKCQKDEAKKPFSHNPDSISVLTDRTDSSSYWLGLVSKVDGRLKFHDINHFIKVTQILDNQIEANYDAFLSSYPNASDIQLDSLSDATNFNDISPILAFESAKNFVSQRKKTKELMDAWFSNTLSTTANCPANTRSLDRITTALVAENGDIQLGEVVTKFKSGLAEDTTHGICVPYGIGFASYSISGGSRKELLQIGLVQVGLVYSKLTTIGSNWRKTWVGWVPSFRKMRMNHKKDPNFTVSCEFRGSFNEFQSDFKNRPVRFIQTWRWATTNGLAYKKLGMKDGLGVLELQNNTPSIFTVDF